MKHQLNHKKNLKIIFLTSLGLSLFGFIIDLKELDPSVVQNIKDITLMTVLIFIVGLAFYLISVGIMKLIPRNT